MERAGHPGVCGSSRSPKRRPVRRDSLIAADAGLRDHDFRPACATAAFGLSGILGTIVGQRIAHPHLHRPGGQMNSPERLRRRSESPAFDTQSSDYSPSHTPSSAAAGAEVRSQKCQTSDC